MTTDPGRRAPPVGRALRFVLGALLLADVVPAYRNAGAAVAVGALLIVLLLLAAYAAWHYAALHRLARIDPWLGALLATGFLVVVYVLGEPGALLFGRGEGALGVVTFLAASLIVAAMRGDPGCEVLAVPGWLFGRRAHLHCLLFSFTDRLENRLWNRHAAG